MVPGRQSQEAEDGAAVNWTNSPLEQARRQGETEAKRIRVHLKVIKR